jgi:hypothetical protein
MTDTTQIVLALISAGSGAFSAWMAGRSRRHAATSAAGASFVAQSLRPPGLSTIVPPVLESDPAGPVTRKESERA